MFVLDGKHHHFLNFFLNVPGTFVKDVVNLMVELPVRDNTQSCEEIQSVVKLHVNLIYCQNC